MARLCGCGREGHVRFVVSRPFRRRKRKGRGTQLGWVLAFPGPKIQTWGTDGRAGFGIAKRLVEVRRFPTLAAQGWGTRHFAGRNFPALLRANRKQGPAALG